MSLHVVYISIATYPDSGTVTVVLIVSFAWQWVVDKGLVGIMARILIVDDQPYTYEVLSSNLEGGKHSVSLAKNIEEARQKVTNTQFEAILTDQRLPDGDGLEVLAAAHQADPQLAVVFLTAEASLELAVKIMRKGAYDFLAKPFSPDVLRAAVQRACDHTMLLRERGNGSARLTNLAWIEALPPSFDLRGLLSTVEKAVIERTLQATGGAQAEAARRLGLSRSDLSYKLLKYELRKETTVS
jgi:DNA-binding NtrC family response regulator